jgi:hypothetical protein
MNLCRCGQVELAHALYHSGQSPWDNENKCKEFLTTPNTTPEEREAHELKVKRCLKNGRK